MSLLLDLKSILSNIDIPVETAVLESVATNRYIILTPIVDTLSLYSDNLPNIEVEEVRISIYDKENYLELKNLVTKLMLKNDITITERRYIGYEENTGYYHYSIDVEKEYNLEEN